MQFIRYAFPFTQTALISRNGWWDLVNLTWRVNELQTTTVFAVQIANNKDYHFKFSKTKGTKPCLEKLLWVMLQLKISKVNTWTKPCFEDNPVCRLRSARCVKSTDFFIFLSFKDRLKMGQLNSVLPGPKTWILRSKFRDSSMDLSRCCPLCRIASLTQLTEV